MVEQPMSCADANKHSKPAKIRTHFAKIIVGGTPEKPVYDILHYDPADKQYHIGFGSYNLNYVFKWLEEEFEIVGDDSILSKEPEGVHQ